jgi:DNA replication protein DnaC
VETAETDEATTRKPPAEADWEHIFKEPMTTAAAIDHLVHHAAIVEFNVPSYRTRKRRRSETEQGGSAAAG